MATISKFYLLDATSPDTGILPGSSNFIRGIGGGIAGQGDATGARTARDATDVHGSSNPDTKSLVTSTADQLSQAWGHRRFISRPLAAHTFAAADGNWTFSYARQESNLNHNQAITCYVYTWRPSVGLITAAGATLTGTEPTVAATEQAESITAAWGAVSVTIIDGDILVFDISTSFIQSMSTSYTEQFSYDGTTEASTTTCASFVTPPSALQLFAGVTSDRTYLQAVSRAAVFCLGDLWVRRGRLWTPRPEILVPA